MRAVEDHHVDRLGVEVQQCTKLTSTNSSIGLITLIYQCSSLHEMADQIITFRLRALFVCLVIMAECPHPIPSRTRS